MRWLLLLLWLLHFIFLLLLLLKVCFAVLAVFSEALQLSGS